MSSRTRVTIRDIAREAGVSTATVSRVMNNPDTVSRRTLETVNAVIARHGYLSDGIAVSLALARTLTIGVVIPTITNSIYAASTQAIQGAARAAGYTVLLGVSEFSPTTEDQLIRQLLKRRVDGLILTGVERSSEIYESIGAARIPFVVTWKQADAAAGMASVSFDNYQGARLAMSHLVELGHRRIGLVCGRSKLNDRARERRRAYQDVMREIGTDVRHDWVHEADFDHAEGRRAMQKLLAAPSRPTAVFCANDIQAIGALFECQEQGIEVPGQISIVGFDDVPAAQYVRPQLTTIRVPAQAMGEIAAKRLLEAIDRRGEPVGQTLPVELVVRGTTRQAQD
ncbi:MAG: LacI family DNA-binding transcriptional regulator [Rhizobiaceae bacterium]|nr:LacI family DNA-binding transcriptional regulator [Rhizobiaceae bacterium]